MGDPQRVISVPLTGCMAWFMSKGVCVIRGKDDSLWRDAILAVECSLSVLLWECNKERDGAVIRDFFGVSVAEIVVSV